MYIRTRRYQSHLCYINMELLLLISVLLLSVIAESINITPLSEITRNVTESLIPDCVWGSPSTRYVIRTREHPDGVTVDMNSTKIPVKKNTKTYIVCHGFTITVNYTPYLDLNNIILNKSDVNIVDVDWSKGSCSSGGFTLTQYLSLPIAISDTKIVGESIADFIGKRLINDCGLKLEDMIVIGHSLGAHTASHCAKYIQQNNIGTLCQLWGLDPAGNLPYEMAHCEDMICATDAKCVLVFHTSLPLGIIKPCGTTDFYFDYTNPFCQPGCENSTELPMMCSHVSAIRYLGHIIDDPTCDYVGKRWNRTDPPPTLDCSQTTCAKPGPLACLNSAEGIYYVDTTKLPENCVSQLS